MGPPRQGSQQQGVRAGAVVHQHASSSHVVDETVTHGRGRHIDAPAHHYFTQNFANKFHLAYYEQMTHSINSGS